MCGKRERVVAEETSVNILSSIHVSHNNAFRFAANVRLKVSVLPSDGRFHAEHPGDGGLVVAQDGREAVGLLCPHRVKG